MKTFATLFLLFVPTIALADNWPAWRGPTGQGHSAEKNPPLKWSTTENVRWKTKLSNPGNSTPIVWGDRVFVTQATTGGKVRSLMAFDRATGKELWKNDVPYGEKEASWKPTWYANASPATDGERVVVSFGSAGMYCYDLAGKELWKRTDLGTWEDPFGNSSSPIFHQDMAILWCGPNRTKGRNFLLAVDKKTGKTVWEQDESFGSWMTPIVVDVKGQDQLLLAYSRDVKKEPLDKTGYFKGFDPKSGKEIWRAQGVNSYVYSSPLYANGIGVIMSGYQGAAFGLKLGGTGDITENRVWVHPKNVQRVGSGVIVDGNVYMIDENGTPRCYDLQSGKNHWENADRLPGSTWGSLIAVDGRLFVMMNDGTTHVMKASPKFELLASNRLEESTNSSPVFSNGEFFLRTFDHLWCIGEKK